MPGVQLKVVGRTEYVFDNLAASAYQDMLVGKGFDITNFREVTLEVRVHGFNLAGTIEVHLRPELPSSEEPQSDFVIPGTGSPPLSSSWARVILTNSGTSYPALFTAALPANSGSTVRCYVRGIQAATPGFVNAYLSIEINCKS